MNDDDNQLHEMTLGEHAAMVLPLDVIEKFYLTLSANELTVIMGTSALRMQGWPLAHVLDDLTTEGVKAFAGIETKFAALLDEHGFGLEVQA